MIPLVLIFLLLSLLSPPILIVQMLIIQHNTQPSRTIDGTVDYNTVEKLSNMKIVKSVRTIEIRYF